MSYLGTQPIPKASRFLLEYELQNSSQIVNVPAGYTVGNISVSVNGLRLQTEDYIATDGLTIDLGEEYPIGTEIIIEEFRTFEITRQASENVSGVVKRASQAQAEVGTDDAAYMTPLKADQHLKANILGTVSQSTSVPTGAIIERGSNANGEYVKFADGTAFAWHTNTGDLLSNNIVAGSIFRSEPTTMVFPITFIATPSIKITTTTSSRWGGISGSSTASQCGAWGLSFNTSDGQYRLGFEAIGRWY